MSTNKPTILMTHSEASAVGLYRVWRPAKWLSKLGWNVRTLPEELPGNIPIEPNGVDKSWTEYAEGIDMIVIQRSDNPEFIALALAIKEMQGCPLVFEIDDNIYDVSRNSPSYEWFYPGSPYIETVELFMQNVDAITVSTQALADLYRKLNPNVYVLPNAQDEEDWKGAKKHDNEHLTIGWAGGFTHYDDLYMIRRPLKRILKKYPYVRFKIVGMLPDFLKNHPQVELVKKFVSTREFPKYLGELGFDIGLAPVVDRPFNRGKSNIKWQEYSMLSIPTIASRVGEYREIEEGVTGLLAEGVIEWEYRLEQLIKDAELRKTLGKNAKQYTLENNNIKLNIGKYDAVYSRILSDYRESISRS